jgi:hypothetical protein
MQLKIDEGSDSAVKSVVIANVAVEAFVSLAMLGIMAAQLGAGEKILAKIKREFVKWRTEFFGPPPPSEEEIANWARLLHIEAARIVREAQS